MLSKKLTSVQLSAIATSDDKAPYYISGIKQKNLKYSMMLLQRLLMFTGTTLYLMAFLSSLSKSSVVTTLRVIMTKFLRFLKAPLKEIRYGSIHTVLLEQFRFLFGYVKMHHNELCFSSARRVPVLIVQAIRLE